MPIHPAIDAALVWAERADPNDPGLQLRDYRLRHEAVRRLFRQHVNPGAFHTVLAGAYAICGLTGRQLREVNRCRFERARWWLSLLAENDDGAVVFAALQRLTPQVRHGALTFINDSAVATSKFLHFLNPACAPIWDSRAAACLDLRPMPDHTPEQQAAAYCEYWDLLISASCAGASLPPRFQNTLNAPLDAHLDRDRQRASRLCALEVLLFQYGSWIAASNSLKPN